MSLAWICRLKCIVYFCFFMILCLGTSFRRLKIVNQQLKYSQSDVLRSISDNVVNIRQHKALNYIYPRRKKIPFFMPYMAFFVLCLTYMSPRSLLVWLNTLFRVVSLSFLFSDTLYPGNISSWRSYYWNIFLFAWYVSCACELFYLNLIVFASNNFHKQLY